MTTDPRVDAYIARSATFARPILRQLRALVHAACPAAQETIKNLTAQARTLESQQKYLATAGKIIDGVKNEFDAFFTGVHAGAHIDIKTQIALEGIGKDIAKLAGNYPLDGNVK